MGEVYFFMKVLYILLDAAVLVMIVLIAAYLIQDRRRFRVERQFSAVKSLFNEWMELGGTLDGGGDCAAAYRKTRNISKKYRCIAEMSRLVWGRETPRMTQLADELAPFCAVYEALAEDYDRHLMGKLRAPLMRVLGFRELPKLELTTQQE